MRRAIKNHSGDFAAIIGLLVLSIAVAGFVLNHERFRFPLIQSSPYTLNAEFQTAQAVTPGQGQAVTIAGAKVGEVASVELHQGIAVVSMKVTPKYAHFYKNATLLIRPKTQLQDITIEVNPGDPSAGKLNSGETLPLSQTAPNVNFDEFLAGLDAETRAYLQLLLAGAGKGFGNNGPAFAATLKRFEPAARLGSEIQKELSTRSENISRSIHNFRLLTETLGTKDKQIAELVDASNAVFRTFAKEDTNLQSTLKLLPGALHQTGKALNKVGEASEQVTPALTKLNPFAKSLAPAEEASKKLAIKTAPIIKNEIRPFAREILPTVNELAPSTEDLAAAFPHLTSTFSVINEFFNELGYNPGKGKAGFDFFLAWANHDLNSVVSNADARGTVGRSLIYFNCEILPILNGVAEVNENVSVLVGLLRPPTKQECISLGLKTGGSTTSTGRASARTGTKTSTPFGNLGSTPFGQSASTKRAAAAKKQAHTASSGGRG